MNIRREDSEKEDIKQGYKEPASPVEGTLPLHYAPHDAGAFSLVGLKVSGPDIEDTLNSYMEQANAADLFVVAGYGLSDEDQAEIKQENADVEFGYFVDTVVGDTPSAIRVFSSDEGYFDVRVGEWRVSYEIKWSGACSNDG